MSSAEQFVRGGLTKDQLEDLRGHPRADALLARLGEATVVAIDAATRVSWLPGAINFAMVEAVADVLGLDGGRTFYFDTFSKAWDTPLFRAAVRGSLRLVGSDPGGLLKMLPRGNAMVFRGFGDYDILRRDASSIDIRHRDIPARCFDRDGAWIHFEAASQLSVIALTGLRGEADVDLEPDRLRATLRYRW